MSCFLCPKKQTTDGSREQKQSEKMPEVEEEEESPFRDSVVKWVRDVVSSICNFELGK